MTVVYKVFQKILVLEWQELFFLKVILLSKKRVKCFQDDVHWHDFIEYLPIERLGANLHSFSKSLIPRMENVD